MGAASISFVLPSHISSRAGRFFIFNVTHSRPDTLPAPFFPGVLGVTWAKIAFILYDSPGAQPHTMGRAWPFLSFFRYRRRLPPLPSIRVHTFYVESSRFRCRSFTTYTRNHLIQFVVEFIRSHMYSLFFITLLLAPWWGLVYAPWLGLGRGPPRRRCSWPPSEAP